MDAAATNKRNFILQGFRRFGLTSACPVQPIRDKSMTDEELVRLARDAAGKAYAPYSKYQVGCAIESVGGQVVTGANMENACYRLGICAEQSALTAAQHNFGLDKVARVAVVGGTDETVCTPCGGCRQAILEAAQLGGRDIEILCASGDGSAVERHTIGELIPNGFGPANLAKSEGGLS
jgi:cytidine deaminase